MIKRIDTKSGKIISYVYNLKDEDYKVLSERLEIEEEKIKNVINEETFTLRISKSDWEICKTTRETYSSYIGNNINITMKVLAVVTIVNYSSKYDFWILWKYMKDKVL